MPAFTSTDSARGNRLPPRHESLWSWSDDGEAIVWADGSTIAFELEISVILSELSTGGRPPRFGALVLLLAACRGKVPFPASLDAIIGWSKNTPAPDAPPTAIKSYQQKEMLRARLLLVLENLTRLASTVPRDLVSDRRGKTILAEAVFESAPDNLMGGAGAGSTDYNAADDILQRLGGQGAAGSTQASGGHVSYLQDLQALEPGLASLDGDALKLRLKTGLDLIPKEADVDIPASQQALELLAELESDPEFKGLGRVVRDIMAALYLRRPPLASRDILAVGGISDLSNKGQLHRLLLSELANDDLVLSVRLAMNEALFLCPDPPAHSPPHSMALLMDSGIRMWGVSRVFAVAVALAWITRQASGKGIAMYRATAEGVAAINLLQRKGLEDHLGVLETLTNAAGALPDFLQEAERLGNQGEEKHVPDLLIISHPKALQDKEFLDALSAAAPEVAHLAAVDRDGRFTLERWTPHGRTLVTEAVISLDALFETPPPIADSTRKTPPRLADPHEQREPEFLRIKPPPLLLPLHGTVDTVLENERMSVALTTDGHFWTWIGKQSGACEIMESKYRGKTIWAGWLSETPHAPAVSDPTYFPYINAVDNLAKTEPGNALFVKHRAPPGTLTLCTVDRSSAPVSVRVAMLTNTDHPPTAVWLDNGVLYILIKQAVRLYDPVDAKEIGKLELPPEHRHVHGRYFRWRELFYYSTWDGKRASLQILKVKTPPNVDPSEICLVFDRPGKSGPWLLTSRGQVVNTADNMTLQLGQFWNHEVDLDRQRVSTDGNSLLLRFRRDKHCSRYHLDRPQHNVRVGMDAEAPWGVPEVPSWALRKRFSHIAPLPNGGLVLKSAKGQYLHLETLGPDEMQHILFLREAPGSTTQHGLSHLQTAEQNAYSRTFKPYLYKEDVSFTLSVAEWEDGSRAFLDSRGLLHLQPARKDLAEVTLVLAERVAGWTSHGDMCGPRFFTGLDQPPKHDPVWKSIQAFSKELR
ncbi:MAG TPA: hypothetical protein VK970_15350 [Candidatus Methylacidiphilales bacterium]|nr:hypothetical protein [Candidatus Methylacidiphilales bacterium]